MADASAQASAGPSRSRSHAWWTAALVLAGLIVALSGILTDRPMDTHEIFAAQTAREMIASGDWVRPSFNDKPRLNKPPLQYWLIGGMALATGNGDDMPPWVARSASLLAGLALIVVTVRLGTAVFDRRAGLLGAALLIASIAFFEYTNSARAEMLYALTCAGMLACLVRAHDAVDGSGSQRLWAAGAWAWIGVSVLAKGPHVPLLLVAGFALAMAVGLREPRRILKVVRPFTGVVVATAICAPWIIAMIVANKSMLAHWGQQLFSDRPPDEKLGVWNYLSPFYFYMFPAMLLPVSVFLPFGLAVSFQKHHPELRRGLLLFGPALLTLVVMGFFTHRRDYYLLGLCAPVCVLCARGVRDFLEGLSQRTRWWRFHPDVAVAGLAVVCMVSLAIAGRSRTIWGESRWQKAAFASQIVKRVGPAAVTFYKADSDAFVYLLSRPIRGIRQPEALVEAANDGPDWVVMPEKQLAALPEELEAEPAARMDTSGTDDPALVLVLVKRDD